MIAVLLSIHPNPCEQIANRKKFLEIRKTKPKLKPPFKCLIYCTNTKYHHLYDLTKYNHGQPLYSVTQHNKYSLVPKNYLNGKVIGEFKTLPCGKSESACDNCKYKTNIGSYNEPEYECDRESGKTLTRPPQSWCYVEEHSAESGHSLMKGDIMKDWDNDKHEEALERRENKKRDAMKRAMQQVRAVDNGEREKEIAQEIAHICPDQITTYCGDINCVSCLSKGLVKAGYRKVPEYSCVICHKDISTELPKIDIYGNKYCSKCYSDKCHKELLDEVRKKTAKEILQRLYDTREFFEILRIAEEYGVEVDI